jgi:hypothetical protein
MMRIKRLFAVPALFVTLTLSAQDYFNHMDLGISVSSTGIGADIAMPVGDYVRLRTGFTYMPKFTFTSNFGVDFMGDVSSDKLRRMKDMMSNFMGKSMQDNIDVQMTPKWAQFKFLVDIMPFKNNKHWNVTLGFYAGPSTIGEAVNDPSGNTTLVGVNMYNNMYIKACKGEPMFRYEDSNGNMHSFDIDGLGDKLAETRMMGAHVGYFPDGSKAVMVPDKNNQVNAELTVSKIRPYIGIGYTTALSRDHRFNMTIDAGAMFMGGSPHVYVDNVYRVNAADDYDMISWDQAKFDETGNVDEAWVKQTPQRIDLTRDVTDIPGKVGDMVSTVKKFKCWPVLSITFSHRLY